jgi:hypothetical protein
VEFGFVRAGTRRSLSLSTKVTSNSGYRGLKRETVGGGLDSFSRESTPPPYAEDFTLDSIKNVVAQPIPRKTSHVDTSSTSPSEKLKIMERSLDSTRNGTISAKPFIRRRQKRNTSIPARYSAGCGMKDGR